MKRLRKAGSLEKIRQCGLLDEVSQLRAIHPAGNRDDIIWLGKLLLRAYKEKYLPKEKQALPTLDRILTAKDDDPELSLKYYEFHREFESVYSSTGHGDLEETELRTPEPICSRNGELILLESAIYHFAEYAGWALPSAA